MCCRVIGYNLYSTFFVVLCVYRELPAPMGMRKFGRCVYFFLEARRRKSSLSERNSITRRNRNTQPLIRSIIRMELCRLNRYVIRIQNPGRIHHETYVRIFTGMYPNHLHTKMNLLKDSAKVWIHRPYSANRGLRCMTAKTRSIRRIAASRQILSAFS